MRTPAVRASVEPSRVAVVYIGALGLPTKRVRFLLWKR